MQYDDMVILKSHWTTST